MTQPQMLILPTSDIVADFFKDVKNMTNHDYDIGEIIKDIFACLSILRDVDDSIANACNKIVQGYVRAHGEDDGLVLANAFGNFARNIKAVFHDAEAWDSNGILRVSYYEAIRDDWVVKIEHNVIVNRCPVWDTVGIEDQSTRKAVIIPESTGVWLFPTENYGGKIVGEPRCISVKEKVNNENNPKQ